MIAASSSAVRATLIGSSYGALCAARVVAAPPPAVRYTLIGFPFGALRAARVATAPPPAVRFALIGSSLGALCASGRVTSPPPSFPGPNVVVRCFDTFNFGSVNFPLLQLGEWTRVTKGPVHFFGGTKKNQRERVPDF